MFNNLPALCCGSSAHNFTLTAYIKLIYSYWSSHLFQLFASQCILKFFYYGCSTTVTACPSGTAILIPGFHSPFLQRPGGKDLLFTMTKLSCPCTCEDQTESMPILQSLQWLPVSFRIDFKILLMLYEALDGLGPFSSVFLLRSILLPIPKVRTKTLGEASFSHYVSHLWNSMRAAESAETQDLPF